MTDEFPKMIDGHNVEIRKGDRVVSLEYIGEGFSGDYDENNPEDAPLLRLDVGMFDATNIGDQYPDDNFSTCTNISARITTAQAEKICEMLMHYVKENDDSLKSLVSAASCLTEIWNGESFRGFDMPQSLKSKMEKRLLESRNVSNLQEPRRITP